MSLPKCPFVFDLLSHLRKNPDKASKIQKTLTRIAKLETRATKGEPVAELLKAEIALLVKLCGHNLGLLMPWLFPSYPDDQPLSLMARPYMFALLSLAGNARVTFRAGRQVGKCVAQDTYLRLSNEKSITIKDLFDQSGK